MATQTDGVLVGNWSTFTQDMLKLYAVNKLGNANSVVPASDTAVVSPQMTPQTALAGINLKSPLVLGGLAVAGVVLFFLLRK